MKKILHPLIVAFTTVLLPNAHAQTSVDQDDANRSFPSPSIAASLVGDNSMVTPKANPTITLDRTSYLAGQNIVVSFANGPGNSTDWIGIYPQGITPSGNPVSTLWFYTNGTRTRGGALTQGSVTFSNPSLATGTYHAWFLANDGYNVLAGPVPFSVGDNTPAAPPDWRVEEIRLRHAVTGQPYSGRISSYAVPSSAARTFSKVSGPAWLSVAADGALTGTPPASDSGTSRFTLRVTNTVGGQSADTSLAIEVFPEGQEDPRRIAVMSYNVWGGWGNMNDGFQKGVESIIRAGADIVGFQESSDSHAQNVANALGWQRATSGNGSRQLISRYPIVETFSAGNAIGARIRISDSPRRDIIAYSCHLDYQYYGPYAARATGATPARVLQEENRSQRLPQIQAILSSMSAHLANAGNIPVLFTGDFNAPSHLDWTAATASSHGIGPVAWPVSTAVENAGFLDSYREAHSDPLLHPGDTWSPIHKGTEPQDRIDFIYHKGDALKTLSSEAFTTEVEVIVGAWGTSVAPVANNTWPSDHAAVLTTYALLPVDSDNNGLADVWERRWFQSLGNNPAAISASSGLSHAASMILGLPPVGPSAAPLSLLNGAEPSRKIEFSLSEHAFGKGLVLERSEDLNEWQAVWSFDADPFFSDPLIEQAAPTEGPTWKITITPPSIEPSTNGGFFRLRWQP